MNLHFKKTAVIFSIYTLAQFIVMTGLAMFFYPGGTAIDHLSPGYDFFENFFSDLGRTLTFKGELKTLSYILFAIAMSTAGFAIVLFSMIFPSLFKNNRTARILAVIGGTAGIISGICNIGIIFTPWDLYLKLHLLFVKISFVSFLMMAVFYAIAILITESFPRIYAIVLIIFGLILLAYIWVLFFGPRMNCDKPDPVNVKIQVVAQKIVVYSEIVSMMILGIGALKILKKQASH